MGKKKKSRVLCQYYDCLEHATHIVQWEDPGDVWYCEAHKERVMEMPDAIHGVRRIAGELDEKKAKTDDKTRWQYEQLDHLVRLWALYGRRALNEDVPDIRQTLRDKQASILAETDDYPEELNKVVWNELHAKNLSRPALNSIGKTQVHSANVGRRSTDPWTIYQCGKAIVNPDYLEITLPW